MANLSVSGVRPDLSGGGSAAGTRVPTGAHAAPVVKDPVATEPPARARPDTTADQTVERANRLAQRLQLNYRFGIRDQSGLAFVEVKDSKTGRVLRTFPPEHLLDVHDRLAERAGVLLDSEA